MKTSPLGAFTRLGIEACFPDDLEGGVEAVLRYYGETRSQRPGPDFLESLCAARAGEVGHRRLELTHAALVYLADLDRAGAEVL